MSATSRSRRAAEQAAAGLRGPDELLWHRRVSRNFDSISDALGLALATGDLLRAAHLSTVCGDGVVAAVQYGRG